MRRSRVASQNQEVQDGIGSPRAGATTALKGASEVQRAIADGDIVQQRCGDRWGGLLQTAMDGVH